jgi:hypothetical protein
MSIGCSIADRIKPCCKNCNFFTLFQLVFKKINETNENVHSLQKATAGLREFETKADVARSSSKQGLGSSCSLSGEGEDFTAEAAVETCRMTG